MATPKKKFVTGAARKTAAVKLRLHVERDPHVESLKVSSFLTQTFREMYQPQAAMVNPRDVIDSLNNAKIKFVLMGAHGIGGWMSESRSTQDVDVLVQKSHHHKAVKAVQERFPELNIEDFPVVTRFVDPATEKVVIDIMKPVDAIYKAVLKNTFSVAGSYHIPDLEMALVTKFAAMISPNRNHRKKHLDAADFMGIVEQSHSNITRTKLWRLGELVYKGGGDEVLKLVEDAKRGQLEI